MGSTQVQSFVAQFVIQARIGNHVVIGHTAGVGTPLGVEGHGRILRLADAAASFSTVIDSISALFRNESDPS